MKCFVFLFILFQSLISFAGMSERPPGIIIKDNSLLIPVPYVKHFFSGADPDSARIVFNRSFSTLNTKDSNSTEYRMDILRKSIQKGGGDLTMYRIFINYLNETGFPYYFKLFYKGSSGSIYKVREHKSSGVIAREITLVDPRIRQIEEIKYYPSGKMMTQTQYVFLDTSRKALAQWFDQSFVREGKKFNFYHDGKIKTIQYFRKNKLQDTSYTYANTGQLIQRRIWINDSLISELLSENVPASVVKEANSRRKAFLVGIDKYQYTSQPVTDSLAPELRNLAGCINDVKLLSTTLIEKRGFLPSQVTALTDDMATRELTIASLNNFISNLKKGDIVFLHFSGSGLLVPRKGSLIPEDFEFAFACRDANMGRYKKGHSGYLYKHELEDFFTRIRRKLGQEGQMILSIDACETGSMSGINKKDTEKNPVATANLRGESSDILFNFISGNDASAALFMGSTGKELSYEMQADDGKSYGLYSYYLARGMRDPSVSTTRELFDELYAGFEEYYGRGSSWKQNPGIYSNSDFPLFEAENLKQTFATLPAVKKSGNAYVLSVGISQYPNSSPNSQLSFSNCVLDAKAYSEFFKSQFAALEGNGKYHSFLLTDSSASYKNIMSAINDIIFNSRPEDYFIMNFSGYCRQLTDSSGRRVTYFVPYGLKNISDTNEIKLKGKGIPLSQLKDLLQLVPANNQLFITEAGSTTAFQKEFIQALIESSPTIAALSNKNRIFIVPKSSGLDKFSCNNTIVEHGPLNYYLTHLEDDLNPYGLFQGGVYADAVKYAISKTEINCDYFRTGYFDIFFEKDYVRDLQYFLPEEISQSRGLGVNREAKAALAVGNSKRYALVIGTDKYDGKPDWNDLKNPVLDAKDIAAELENGFGYQVKLMTDPVVDSIYAHILWLSRVLKKNDQLIVYIAGHGDFDSTLLDDGFIVCRNSKPIDKDPYRNTYIQYSKFSRMINRLPANQILMMLDVCFGGTFDERVARNQGRERTFDYGDLSNNTFFAEKLRKRTRLYLTSGGKDVVPDGLDKKHSPFALRLLQAMQGRGGVSKLLTAKNLHQFVEKLPSGPLLGSFGDDEVGSEFILLAK